MFYSFLDLNLNILLDLNWNIHYQCDVTQHDAIFFSERRHFQPSCISLLCGVVIAA